MCRKNAMKEMENSTCETEEDKPEKKEYFCIIHHNYFNYFRKSLVEDEVLSHEKGISSEGEEIVNETIEDGDTP